MSKPLEGKVVFVTGSRAGIGRYLAEWYLDRGAVVVGCSRGPSDLNREGYHHLCLDVGDEAGVRAAFLDIRKGHGRLDVLINNAGLLAAAPVLLTTGDVAQGVLATNFLGTVLCSREAAMLMKKAAWGRIVNLTSVAVPLAPAGSSIYGASKAAVEQFTRVTARELAPFGITVNALGLPPVEKTGMADALGEAAVAETQGQIALGRPVTLTDVAHAVEFLTAEPSGAVTGQTIYLGGP